MFVRVVDAGSFTRAAEQLRLSRPVVSKYVSRLEDRLGAKLGRMDDDHTVELEPVYCLGLCARAPALMVDGSLVVEADQAVDRVVERVRR